MHLAANDNISIFPLHAVDKIRQLFGRKVQVGIAKGDIVTPRVGRALAQRAALALVGLVADAANLRILGCGALDLRFGAVAAAVVDDQQFIVVRQRVDLPRSIDDGFLIISRHQYGKLA